VNLYRYIRMIVYIYQIRIGLMVLFSNCIVVNNTCFKYNFKGFYVLWFMKVNKQFEIDTPSNSNLLFILGHKYHTIGF